MRGAPAGTLTKDILADALIRDTPRIDPESELADPLEAAKARLPGIKYLYPYQRLVVANLLAAFPRVEGRSAEGGDGGDEAEEDRSELGRQIVILPTGLGKSLCFQLPALLLPGPTLIVYPLLALMADQERRFQAAGIGVATLRGGQTGEEREEIARRILSGSVKAILTNPEFAITPWALGLFRRAGISHLVFDEAHCVSEWGGTFRPAYLEAGRIVEAADARALTAFTATASPAVVERIRRIVFPEAGARLVMGNPDRANVHYSVRPCLSKAAALAESVRAAERPAIVFCGSRKGAQMAASFLRMRLGIAQARFYHAGLSREEKGVVERWFYASSEGVLCATCAYGLGVDKPDIRTVIHLDVPPNVEAYLQESGRAGRDGKRSRALLLFSAEDRRRAAAYPEGEERRRYSALLSYAAMTAKCRRETLLSLLGSEAESCSGCDVCEGKSASEPPERLALLRFFSRNPRRFTLPEARLLLADSRSLALVRAGLESHPWRGLLALWSEEEVEEALRALIGEGALAVRGRMPWKGRISVARKELTPRA